MDHATLSTTALLADAATAALTSDPDDRRLWDLIYALQERATRVINQIAEQEKFDLVIQEAVFASSRIDITDKVIRALSDK